MNDFGGTSSYNSLTQTRDRPGRIGFIAIRQFTSAAVKEPQSQRAWIMSKD